MRRLTFLFQGVLFLISFNELPLFQNGKTCLCSLRIELEYLRVGHIVYLLFRLNKKLENCFTSYTQITKLAGKCLKCLWPPLDCICRETRCRKSPMCCIPLKQQENMGTFNVSSPTNHCIAVPDQEMFHRFFLNIAPFTMIIQRV